MHFLRSTVRIVCTTAALVALLPSVGVAADGVFEINQACAAVGCFPGDAPDFPVSIERGAPGSYRLTSNLVNPGEDDTILIRDDHVTLDLNGFAVSGPSVCMGIGTSISCTPTTAGAGVLASRPGGGPTGIVVKNGVVRGAGFVGIQLNGRNHRIEGVHVVGNASIGIYLSDGSALIERCRVVRNAATGIVLSSGVVRGNLVLGNGFGGLTTGGSVRISGNVIRDNASLPMGGADLLVEDNAATENGLQAALQGGSGYARNVFRGNGGGSEVLGGIEIGPNLCGSNTTCP